MANELRKCRGGNVHFGTPSSGEKYSNGNVQKRTNCIDIVLENIKVVIINLTQLKTDVEQTTQMGMEIV